MKPCPRRLKPFLITAVLGLLYGGWWTLKWKVFAVPRLYSLSFSPDGKTLAGAGGYAEAHGVTSYVGHIWLWDGYTGAPRARLVAGKENLELTAFSEDGEQVFGWQPDGKRLWWNPATGQWVGSTGARYLRDGYGVGESRMLYAQMDLPCRLLPSGCRFDDEKLSAHSLEIRKALRVMNKFGDIETPLAFQVERQMVAAARQMNEGERQMQMLIRDARTGKLRSRFPKPLTNVRLARFSPDGKWLLIVQWIGGGVADCVLWNYATNVIVDLQDKQNLSPRTCAFSPDGRRVAVGGFYGEVQLWETQSGKTLAQWWGR